MKHRLRDRNQKQQKDEGNQKDPFRLSIHTLSNFNASDSGSKRLNISRMLENSRKKISMRKASQLFQTSAVRPQSTKIIKRNEVIEFDNIKWISIISAYDPSRLKNVSVSKKGCQKFLSSNQQNIKSDSRNLLYFNDLIRNFKSWHNKIQMQYCYIMNKFLGQRQSANTTLVELRPKLDQVIKQTQRMKQNLEGCLNSYQNHELRVLLEKYYASLVQCLKIEKIIESVDKSKNKIINLYKKFDNDRKIEQKVIKVKNEGINEIQHIASDYQAQIQTKIMEKIQDAINQIAQKSGQAYRKIKGVKELIEKFKNTEHKSQEMKKIDIEAIKFMGKVCKQICRQAEVFHDFSTKFLTDGGINNEDLQKIVKKYEEEVLIERKRAVQLQMKFLNIIFSQTIKKLKDNSKISSVYEDAEGQNQEYKTILRMIQDIADCISDQNKRVALQKLIKQTRTILDRLYDDLKFLKEKKKFQEIDTEEGLISILQVSKLIKEYKQKILIIRKKLQSTHRDIELSPIKIQSVPKDLETEFIASVIELSKKINNSNLKSKILKQPCFSSINQGIELTQMSKHIQNQNILKEITSISNEFFQLQNKNILQKYFGPLKLQNLIFKESIIMIEIKNISLKTQQKNIIPVLTQLLSKRNQWVEKHKKISPQMKRYFERILALTLLKGLKHQDIKQIQKPQNIPFPTKQSQIGDLKRKATYRQVLFDLIQKSVIQTNKSILLQNTQEKSQQKAKNHRVLKSAKIKYNFYISDLLQRSITTINNFVDSFVKIQQIKKNQKGQSYLTKQYFYEFNQKLFTEVFLKKVDSNQITHQSYQKIKILLKQFIEISYEKFLGLTRKIIQEENQWKDKERKNKSQKEINFNKIPIYLQKVLETIEFYKSKAQSLHDVVKQALQMMNNSFQNVENTKEQLSEYLSFSVYAKIINSLVKFCKDTNQKVHVVLDNSKCPILLTDSQENILSKVFPGLKKGKQLPVNQAEKLSFQQAKIGIELKTKRTTNQENKQKVSKEKSKPKMKQSDMDEQIIDDSQQKINDNMEEEYPSDQEIQQMQDNIEDIPDDDMAEQLIDDIQQEQPSQEMIEDFQAPQDQIQQAKLEQEQALQDLIEESQNLGKSKNKGNKPTHKNKTNRSYQQFDEYQWEQKSDKNVRNKKKSNDQKLKNNLENKPKQNALMQKAQIQKKIQQKPKKILQNSVYEVLTFIDSLYQLKNLIIFVASFEQNYFKSFIDWSKIQHFYNDHTPQDLQKDKKQIQKYIKNLQQDVYVKLKIQFKSQPKVFNELEGFDCIKKIKKHLLMLKNGNWDTLINILTQNHLSFNVLKSQNQVLYISIGKASQQIKKLGSIDGFLSKKFKFYKKDQFDIKQFTQKCCNQRIIEQKQKYFSSLTYQIKSQTNFLNKFTQVDQNYQKLVETINDFSDGAKDVINKFDLCLELYKKALQVKQKITLHLDWYAEKIKFLQKNGTEQYSILTYVNFIKQNVKTVIKKVKALESKLYNLTFKCQKNNILQCFNELQELYGSEIQSRVFFQNKQSTFIALLFDKTHVKQNQQKIKNILSSQAKSTQQKVEKVLTQLFLSQKIQNNVTVTGDQLLKRTKKIDFESSQILLEIMAVLRINHSFILINKANLKFSSIRKSKEECIGEFLSTVVKSLIESKNQSAKLLSQNTLFTALRQLLNHQHNLAYQNIFSQQNLKILFNQEIKNEKLYTSTKIAVNEEMFMLDKSWVEESLKLVKEITDCVNGSKKQMKRILGIVKKHNPCEYLFTKVFSKQSQEDSRIWSQYLSNFQKYLGVCQQTMRERSWILMLRSVEEHLSCKLVPELTQNINLLKKLLQNSSPKITLSQILTEIKKILEWLLKNNNLHETNTPFSIITFANTKQIIYFECNNSALTQQFFMNNFDFVDTINEELKQFLANSIFSNIHSNQSQDILDFYGLKKNDKVYEIQTQKLSNTLINFITEIFSPQTETKRNYIFKEIVRVYNKIYFLSKTSSDLNFSLQNQSLESLKKDFKTQIHHLIKLVFSLKQFLSSLRKKIETGSKAVETIMNEIEKGLKAFERLDFESFQDLLKRLQNLRANTKTQSINSYNPLLQLIQTSIGNLIKLPLYKVTTHKIATKSEDNNILAVIVTQKTKAAKQNGELQEFMKEIFSYTAHKPIEKKQGWYIVQLLKQPVFITFDTMINGTQLEKIVEYLNKNIENQGQDKQKQKEEKIFYLRVDEMVKSDQNLIQENKNLLKVIPLTKFVTKDSQQVDIKINNQNLTVSLEFNVIYAPKNIQHFTQDTLKQYVPLNGSSVDSFDKVYLGRRLKLQRIQSWLYENYKIKQNEQTYVTENKTKIIQQFLTEFKQYFLTTLAEESKRSVQKIIGPIDFKSTFYHEDNSISNKKLHLKSSSALQESCLKQLEKFKFKEYQNKSILKKYCHKDIIKLVQNFKHRLYQEILNAETKIKIKMEKTIKLQTKQKIIQIYSLFKGKQQKSSKLKQKLKEQELQRKKQKQTMQKIQNIQSQKIIKDQNQILSPQKQNEKIQNLLSDRQIVDKSQGFQLEQNFRQKQLQIINGLKQTDFASYLFEKIGLFYESISKQIVDDLQQEIKQKFSIKLQQVQKSMTENSWQKLRKKVYEIYCEKQQFQHIDIMHHQRCKKTTHVMLNYSSVKSENHSEVYFQNHNTLFQLIKIMNE